MLTLILTMAIAVEQVATGSLLQDRLLPTQGKVPGGVKQVLAPSWIQQSWLNGEASVTDGTQR
jgi:hypothetical protein